VLISSAEQGEYHLETTSRDKVYNGLSLLKFKVSFFIALDPLSQEEEGPSDTCYCPGLGNCLSRLRVDAGKCAVDRRPNLRQALCLWCFLSHPRWILLSCLGYKPSWHELLYLLLNGNTFHYSCAALSAVTTIDRIQSWRGPRMDRPLHTHTPKLLIHGQPCYTP
jgi:hypothetical protein